MDAPMCKVCGHRHWSSVEHVGFDPDPIPMPHAPAIPQYEFLIRDVPHFVYGLVDPRKEDIFYVGLTTNPKARLASHRNASHNLSVRMLSQEIKAAGLRIEMRVFSEHPNSFEGRYAERAKIKELPGLVNILDGAMCSWLYPPEKEVSELLKKEAEMLVSRYGRAYLSERTNGTWRQEPAAGVCH